MMEIKTTVAHAVEVFVDGPEFQVLVDVCELTRRRLTQAIDLEYDEARVKEILAFIHAIFEASESHGSRT